MDNKSKFLKYALIASVVLSLGFSGLASPQNSLAAIQGSNAGTGADGTNPGTGAGGVNPGTGIGGSNETQSIFTLSNPLKVDSIGGLIGSFLQIFTYLVVLMAVLMLIWTGLQFILARGNSEEMKKQKDRLLYIVIGVAVVIGARIIVQVVINTLKTTGTVDPSVIQSADNALNGK